MTAFIGLRPMLEANDVRATAAFYVEQLGFEQGDFIDAGDGTWAWTSVRRGAVGFMFNGRHFHDGVVDDDHPAKPIVTGSLYINVEDVDALADELRGRGVAVDFGPTDQPHGMREIGLTDPNGYFLLLGQPISG
jgi:uncharacterized glyoxalase superfamily protein PhnB